MSGHSKWNNIKHKKGVKDAQKGKVFSQLSKNIRISIKEGAGIGDPNQNAALRLAIDKARAVNMPMENIKRAIDRATGIGKGGVLEEVIYEGYGPHGVGFIVIVISDNKMRTASEIRAVFSKNGGSLGGPGSVMFLFEKNDNHEYQVKIAIPLTEDQKKDVAEFEEMLLEHDDVEEVLHNGIS